MKNSQKYSTLIIILSIIIALLVVIFGAYVFLNSSPTKQQPAVNSQTTTQPPQSTVTQNSSTVQPIALPANQNMELETYTNNQYGVAFSYPSNLIFETNSVPSDDVNVNDIAVKTTRLTCGYQDADSVFYSQIVPTEELSINGTKNLNSGYVAKVYGNATPSEGDVNKSFITAIITSKNNGVSMDIYLTGKIGTLDQMRSTMTNIILPSINIGQVFESVQCSEPAAG